MAGGMPSHLKFDLDEAMFRSVCKGRMMIPLPKGAKFDELGGPPWGTIATFRHDDQEVHRLVGPVMWHKEQWCLQVCLPYYYDCAVGLPSYRKESHNLIKSNGLGPRTSLRA